MLQLIRPEEFNRLLPLACAWAEAQEKFILRHGVPLPVSLLPDAARVGVRHPDQVRLLSVDQMPVPDQPELRKAAETTGLISPDTIGLALRYGIFIRTDHWNQHGLLIHELAHTAQYERFGGFAPFLREYLWECLTIGYPGGPLEQEARRLERTVGQSEDR